MKTMKKLASLFLALAMVLSLGATALADDDTHSITIEGSAVNGQEFAIYQIFAGKYYETVEDKTNTLSDVTWGSGVTLSGDAELNPENWDEFESEFGKFPVNPETNKRLPGTAVNWATYLDKAADNAAFAKAFAQLISGYLQETEGNTQTGENDKVVFDNLEDGYYFIKNTNIDGNHTATEYMLQVAGDNVKAAVKSGTVEVEKEIDKVNGSEETGSERKSDDASIGDIITYEITAKMPENLDSYKDYFIQFVDTFSEGLTFNTYDEYDAEKDNQWQDVSKYVTVWVVNGTDKIPLTIENNEDYNFFVAKYDSVNATLYVTSSRDLKESGVTPSSKIVVEYSATLNENAKIGTGEDNGNENDVLLKYTNDPNSSGQGNPWEPENPETPENPDLVGETPKDKVVTYTTALEIVKVDGTEEHNILTGAGFTLTGVASEVKYEFKEVFVESENGTWYKLAGKDEYTQTAPDGDNDDEYESIDTKYEKRVVTSRVLTDATEYGVEVMVDKDGKITFTGLKEGEYILKETTTPDGYNTLDYDIRIVVDFDEANNTFVIKAYEVGGVTDGKEIELTENNSGVLSTRIINNSGTQLPETGGIGTTIFTVCGVVLMLGAAVLFISKKRTAND